MNIHHPELQADEESVRIGQPSAADLATPLDQRLNTLQLTDTTCHWPIGDPRDRNFFYCGGHALEGLPYCARHSRISYTPAAERRRK